jgi:malonyl CoA-acyl carrier protein transacylase
VPAALISDPAPTRSSWFSRLAQGLKKTGAGIAQVFSGTRIDDALYEELETALLMADAGVGATSYLLADLKRRVKETKATEPTAVKALLVEQIYSPVQWTRCVETIAGTGATGIIECGPGKVLAGLVKRIDADLTTSSVLDPGSLKQTLELLA